MWCLKHACTAISLTQRHLAILISLLIPRVSWTISWLCLLTFWASLPGQAELELKTTSIHFLTCWLIDVIVGTRTYGRASICNNIPDSFLVPVHAGASDQCMIHCMMYDTLIDVYPSHPVDLESIVFSLASILLAMIVTAELDGIQPTGLASYHMSYV